MNLFSSFFKSRIDPEKNLEDFYVERLKTFSITRKEIKEQISICKKDALNDDPLYLMENFGDHLIEKSTKGNELFRKIVQTALSGGAKIDDIKSWWNKNDLERRMIIWEDNLFRIATFEHHRSKGLSYEEAVVKIRKTYPLYGNSYDESNSQGEDRPLPNELHDRVEEMTRKWDSFLVSEIINSYSSMNAFIRDEIKESNN